MADFSSIYGIGRGGAQVWQGNAGLDALENQYKQEQLKKQKEEAQLQSELAKVNYDKIRTADIPKAIELYGDIVDTFGKIRSTEDRQERITLTNAMRAKQAELDYHTGASRQTQQIELQYDKTRIDKYDEVEDSAHDKLRTLKSLPITDAKYTALSEDLIKNFLAKPFDESKLLKEARDFSADQVKSGTKTRGLGDSTQYYHQEGEQFNPDKFKRFVVEKSKTDKSLMKYLVKNYDGLSAMEAIDAYVADKAPIMASLYKVEDKTDMTDKPDNWRQKADYAEYLRRSRPDKNGNVVAPETVRQDLVQGLVVKDGKARNIVQAQVIANPEYGGKNLVIKSNKNGTTTYEVPPKLNAEGVVKQNAYKVTIEEGKEASAVALNQLLNDVTGENVPYGGYKGIKGNKNKNPVTTTSKPKAVGGYKIGEIQGGYKYTGGDPANQSNWQKVSK